ncbi:hypothetical protein PS15p_207429 [Mucor circinelloides]
MLNMRSIHVNWREEEHLQCFSAYFPNVLCRRRGIASSSRTLKTYNNKEDEEQEEDSDAPPNDDSFHSNHYHSLRKNIYLCTSICREFNIDKNPSWIVNGFNVSKALSQFGLNSLLLHDKGDALSDMRLLPLDHIYALANDISSSVTK